MTAIAMEDETFRLADVFSKAFAVYRRRFAPFIIITIIASIPNYIALFVLPIPDMTGNPDPQLLINRGLSTMALGLISIVTGTVASGAVIYGVIQELRGRAFSIGDSILVALRRLLPMIGVAICMTIVILLGMILLVVPGLMFLCMFFVSAQACVAERAGVFASMSRSSFLTKGYRWQVFGTVLLLGIAIGILNLSVARILLLGFPGVPLASPIGTQALATIIGSFNGVLFSVFYFQLRVAKEGIDIDKIASVFD